MLVFTFEMEFGDRDSVDVSLAEMVAVAELDRVRDEVNVVLGEAEKVTSNEKESDVV